MSQQKTKIHPPGSQASNGSNPGARIDTLDPGISIEWEEDVKKSDLILSSEWEKSHLWAEGNRIVSSACMRMGLCIPVFFRVTCHLDMQRDSWVERTRCVCFCHSDWMEAYQVPIQRNPRRNAFLSRVGISDENLSRLLDHGVSNGHTRWYL